MKNNIKITVVGSGYVGMSLAVLLAQQNDVVVLDIDPSRVDKLNNKVSPVKDNDIEAFLAEKELYLKATLEKQEAYTSSNYVIIATSTNYDHNTNQLDTSSVDMAVSDALKLASDALIVIKSTVPLGHTKSLQDKFKTNRIIFSPEFLREGQALKDNLYPSRIIVGSELDSGRAFTKLLVNGAFKEDIDTLFMSSTEAEAVKLFANTYLAMRVSFFNELDSYALSHGLNTNNIIDGVCLDSRIGNAYNNPSFGYGGYCLPKDTKQLLSNFRHTPQALISAVIKSNSDRKDFISQQIINRKPKIIGIYRLTMKQGSDNFRESAIQGIIKRLETKDIEVVIYEPSYRGHSFLNSRLISSLDEFKSISEIIITNRMSDDLNDVEDKVFTRDIFGSN